MKRKRGRPALPATKRASEIMSVRVTAAELRRVKRWAKEDHVSISKLVRTLLFGDST